MRRPPLSRLVLATLVFALAQACGDEILDPAPPEAARPLPGLVAAVPDVCSTTFAVDLVADENVVVGTVEISNDEGHLYVAYRTSPSWPIGKTALWVGDDPAEIPGKRNPKVGQFPHSANHPAGTTEVVWEVELDVLAGPGAVIAAFAEVGVESEGAWAAGEPLGQGGSWATFVAYDVETCLTRVVGAEGDVIEFQGLTLEIPAGALADEVSITVSAVSAAEVAQESGHGAASARAAFADDAPAAGPPASHPLAATPAGSPEAAASVASTDGALAINGVFFLEGTGYRLGPDGLQFQQPVKVTIGYDDQALPAGVPEGLLRVFAINGVFFDPGPNPDLVNEEADEASTFTTHFTDFIVGGPTHLADLGVTMTVEPDPVDVDEDLVHTITVTNHGPDDASDVRVGLIVEGDVDIKTPSQEGCTDLFSASPPKKLLVNCPAGDLASGESAMLTLVVVPNVAGETLTSTALIEGFDDAEDPDESNDEAVETTTVESADPGVQTDLRMELTAAPDPVAAGGDLVHTLTITNLGPNPVTDVTVSLRVEGDVLIKSPMQEGCTDLTSTTPPEKLLIDCPVLDLSFMDSDQLTLVLVPQTPGEQLTSTAMIESFSQATDSDPSNNTAVETTDVIAGADLEVVSFTLTPDPVLAGDPLTHTFTIRNNGPANASTINVAVRSTGDLGFPASHPDCHTKVLEADGAGYNCTISALAAGASQTLSVDLIPGTAGETIQGVVRLGVHSGPDDPDASNDERNASADVVASLLSGTVVFTSDRDGSSDLYVKDLSSGVITQLTNADVDEFTPEWSPDGARIAFRRESATFLNQFDIWVIGADGSGLTRLTTTGTAGAPRWSPDGTEIAYNDSDDGDWEVYVLQVASPSTIRKLTDNSGVQDMEPDWSPDGSTIVYRRPGSFGAAELRTLSAADGSGDAQILSRPAINSPVWSPDGGAIAFSRLVASNGERDIEVLDLATSAVATLVADGLANAGPGWSPDGSYVIFAKNGLDPNLFDDDFDLWAVARDGSGAQVEVEASAADDLGPDWK